MCVLCTRMDLIQVCLDAEDVVLPEEPILLDNTTVHQQRMLDP